MSISSLGGAGSGISQLMASLLSRLRESGDASSSATTSSTSSSTDDSDQAATSNALTGSTEGTLSDQVIGALVMMQMQNDAQPSSSSSGQDSTNPISQAFSSLDTDGDGTISQSELETAIENAGGTAADADTVFSALGGTSTSGISESAFTQAAQAGAPPPPPDGGPGGPGGAKGHHHHHHNGQASGSASDEAAQIFSSLQTNQDGTVSDDVLASALGLTTSTDTSSSTTTSSSNSTDNSSTSDLLSAIDTNGDGSVSQSELTSYLENLQQQSQGDQSTLGAFWQLANQSYNTNLGLFSTNSTQVATA